MTPRFTTVLILFFSAAAAPLGLAAADSRRSSGAQQSSTGPAPPAAAADEASAGNADPCSDLEARAQDARTGGVVVAAAVDAAQCILARRCAGPLSLQLAGSNAADAELTAAANSAMILLDRASQYIEHDGAQAPDRRELVNRIESLRAFGNLFVALGRPAGDDAASKELLAACTRLAPSLDEPDAELVESAKLWLGFAYRRAGRPDRTLQVVRPIVTAPTSRRIGLLARLQRCQALGETGRHAAGIALCERLAVRADAWLAREDEATRLRASESIRCVRIELLRGWANELRRAGEADRATAAEVEVAKLRGSESDSSPPDRRLVLEIAVAGLPERPPPTSSLAADEGD